MSDYKWKLAKRERDIYGFAVRIENSLKQRMPFRYNLATATIMIVARYCAPANIEQATYVSREVMSQHKTVKRQYRKNRTGTILALIETTIGATEMVVDNWNELVKEIDPKMLERWRNNAVNTGVLGAFYELRNDNNA